MKFWLSILSDQILFWVIQSCIFVIFVVSLAFNLKENKSKNQGGVSLSVERGDKSMAIFYGSYAALNGLLVALCLSIEVTKGYRVIWVIVDTVFPAYICLFNPWARNKILGWVHYLKKLEA